MSLIMNPFMFHIHQIPIFKYIDERLKERSHNMHIEKKPRHNLRINTYPNLRSKLSKLLYITVNKNARSAKKLKFNLSIRKHDEVNRNLNGFMSVHVLVYKSFTGNSLYL